MYIYYMVIFFMSFFLIFVVLKNVRGRYCFELFVYVFLFNIDKIVKSEW